MKQSAFKVSEIRPNPFRDIKRYPLEKRKIEALRESIRATSFWENLVARIGADGKPEIAYGHHRLEAVRQELGKDAEVRLIIKDVSDTLMLKMMLRENMETWQTNALVDQASVRAVVDAYADGKVELRAPEAKTPKAKLRYAPGFRQGDVAGRDREHPYTAAPLAAFMGWDRTKAETTLAALELIERQLVEEFLYEGSTQSEAALLTTEVRKVVYAHDAQAKEYEKHAKAARTLAEDAETKKERDAQEKLAEGALLEAAAVRERMKEKAEYVAFRVRHTRETVERRVVADLAKVTELPPLPHGNRHELWSDSHEIDMYVGWVYQYINHVRQMRELAEQFSPEQMTKAVQEGRSLQEELAALETAFKQAICERQQRGAAPVRPQKVEKKKRDVIRLTRLAKVVAAS